MCCRRTPLPPELDAAKVKQAIDAAFEPAAELTAAFVVTWRGRLIGERYADRHHRAHALESWSMGKSVTATLMGILINQGVYELSQPAPIPEWQAAGDPRAKIRMADILNMSSGLRIKAPQDPDYDPAGAYPDHLYLYTGRINSFHVRRDAPAAMAARHGGPLSQHRSGADQLSRFVWPSRSAGRSICRSRSARCSTKSASGRW